MRQVFIPRIGGPDVLEVRESTDPEPGPGEVRVRVEAAGINFADIMARMGLYPDAPPVPCVVGYETAGVVDAVGPGVDAVKEGDRVAALCRFGGYSDAVVVPEAQAIAIGELPFEVAAGVPVAYLTAWLMLVWHAHLAEGETVLVHAAAGGVGQAATQIALWRGAQVVGTASPGKHERLREAGVAHCIDYRSQDFEEEVMRYTGGAGVDVVLDAQGGKSFSKSYACLKPLGRLCCFGAASFAPKRKRDWIAAIRGLLAMPKFKPFDLMENNRVVIGVNVGHLWEQVELLSGMLREIYALVQDGTFAPHIDATFSFDEAAAAHEYIQARKNFGKVLLVP